MTDLRSELTHEINLIRCVRLEPSGRFEIDPEGVEAHVIGVEDHGEIFDAVAYLDHDPTTWWTLRGECAVLGAHAIRTAAFSDRPLILVATPRAWLQRSVIEGER